MFESVHVRETKRMWAGGPLRQFAAERSGWGMPYAGGGFVGMYVCDGCSVPTAGGVYRDVDGLWYCAGCREKRPKGEN